MKVLVVFVSVLLAVGALTDEEQWKTFKNNFGKTYKSAREESTRFGIFQNNLRNIEAHNAKYERAEKSWAKGVNQFTDLTAEEVRNLFNMPKFNPPKEAEIFRAEKGVDVPQAIDWRKKGAVLEVLNQGACGSCYAFSAVESLEGQRAIKHNIRQQLSEQEVVDCAESYGPNGCGGGWMNDVYNYIRDNGISLSSDYKYQAHRTICKNFTTDRVDVKVTGTKLIDNNLEAYTQAVGNIGPISMTINAADFDSYSNGIYDDPGCKSYPTHAMLIVGYGTENGTDYWIVKNSWGKAWGENGYMRIRRYEVGVCGMFNYGMFPVIE